MKLSLNEISVACKEIPARVFNTNVYSIDVWSRLYLDNNNFDMGKDGLKTLKAGIENVTNDHVFHMEDPVGKKLSISMENDLIEVTINGNKLGSCAIEKFTSAVDKAIHYQSHNREVLNKLIEVQQFSIVEKDVGGPVYNDVDGWSEEVFPSGFCEECDFYSMLLVGEPTEGGSWDLDENNIYPHSDNEPDLKDIKSRWIPLPVIVEMLAIDLDWFIDNEHDNPIHHKTADVIAAINDAIV